MILRVAETFAARVSVYDPTGVFGDATRRSTISDFACGALQRHPPRRVASLEGIVALRKGCRLIATTIEAGAVSLTDFVWRQGDLVAIGNEYDGLPEELVLKADVRLCIPLPDIPVPKPRSHTPIDPTRDHSVAREGTPNLNAAMATGIILYDAYRRLTAANAADDKRAR
jgi:tRNA G18 (ribose-2'-O)-methylase SpoU